MRKIVGWFGALACLWSVGSLALFLLYCYGFNNNSWEARKRAEERAAAFQDSVWAAAHPRPQKDSAARRGRWARSTPQARSGR